MHRNTLAGVCSLIVAMSISRFAYTPILPHMLAQHAISHTEGALLASSNLLAYLLGALAAGAPALRPRRVAALRIALIVNVVTLFGMYVPNAHALWMLARLFSGVSSAFVFVFASTLVLELRNAGAATALFASVGAGIALSGVLVPAAYERWPHWNSAWLICTILAAILACIAIVSAAPAKESEESGNVNDVRVRNPHATFALTALAYGIAGFSYIVPATFLVAIVSAQPALHTYASISWVIVGVVAAVSIAVWSSLAHQFGKASMLVCALLLLGVGCAGPVIARNAAGALIGAFGLGASFMAISMLCVGIVRDLDPKRSSTRIAQATVIFSVGQVLGPLFTAYSYGRSGSYNEALLTAACALVLAAALVGAGIQVSILQLRNGTLSCKPR